MADLIKAAVMLGFVLAAYSPFLYAMAYSIYQKLRELV